MTSTAVRTPSPLLLAFEDRGQPSRSGVRRSGCYFVVPADRSGGWAVIRAVQSRTATSPIITLVRREEPKR